jgi:hypothetical protein
MSLEDSYGPLASFYGPFTPIFETTAYLELLRLNTLDAQGVIDRIAAALEAADSHRWVTTLLHDANWRPHLVAAITLLLDRTLDPSLLWHAIDRGSWVVPQLVVTAAHVDPRFRERIRERVEAHCPMVDRTGSRSEPDDLVGGRGERRSKMLVSMLAMSAELTDMADWVARINQDERIKTMLAIDASSSNSDKIVASWVKSLRAAFGARGQTLNPIDGTAIPIAPATDIDRQK